MVEPPTIPVLESKLQKLERDHEFLEAIRRKNEEVAALRGEYAAKKDESLAAKKAYDVAATELQQLIENGPTKPDPQKRLPFAEDKAEAPEAEDESSGEQAEAGQEPEAPAEAEVVIPAEIDALDITDLQKRRLTEAGCQTLADVVDLGNKNWPQYPEGFESLGGFGPKAAAKLWAQLPSTAPQVDTKGDEVKKIRVRLETFAAGHPNLIPENEYDATELPNGHIIIQLPNEEPVEFMPHEFKKVEAVPV